MWTPDLGQPGQERLKAATVLISRIGGIGGTVAMHLAAAGVGRLILAHGGDLRLNDLNRQLLMKTSAVGQARLPQAAERLREINPHTVLELHESNLCADSALALSDNADLIVSAAPLFEERLAMNAAAVGRSKPIIHAAMYDMEASVMTTLPGQTACLACVMPEPPEWWRREFPVFGAVAGVAASLAAVEAIKILSGVGQVNCGKLIALDLRNNHLRTLAIARDPQCPVCGSIG